jgi:hypothetical protein
MLIKKRKKIVEQSMHCFIDNIMEKMIAMMTCGRDYWVNQGRICAGLVIEFLFEIFVRYVANQNCMI